MRILIVANVPRDLNSGAAGTVLQTSQALRDAGHVVDEILAPDMAARRIAHGNLHSLLEQPRVYRSSILKAVNANDYDVVMMSQPQAYLAARSLKRKKFSGVVVNRSHGLELRVDDVMPNWHKALGVAETRFPRSLATPVLRKFLQRQWASVLKYVDGVVLPCEMDRNFLINRFPGIQAQLRTVHHGVSESVLAAHADAMTDERLTLVLHVGQFAFFKGPHLVARIMERVFDLNPRIRLTWVTTEAACSEARALIDPKHWHRVRMVPWTTQEELAAILGQHGVFLFPSLCEGAAKSVLEAMAKGLCVVASDDSGMRDYICDRENGRLCEVGDVEAFAQAVIEAVEDPNATSISEGASLYARTKTWAECARKLVAFFEELKLLKGPDKG